MQRKDEWAFFPPSTQLFRAGMFYEPLFISCSQVCESHICLVCQISEQRCITIILCLNYDKSNQSHLHVSLPGIIRPVLASGLLRVVGNLELSLLYIKPLIDPATSEKEPVATEPFVEQVPVRESPLEAQSPDPPEATCQSSPDISILHQPHQQSKEHGTQQCK